MGKKLPKNRSKTLPSSPTHSFSSSSSSDFEFRISVSPRKSAGQLCPADELFYKGQLLPLHLSPRISMVRTLLLASSSTSSSSATDATASRDSSSSTDSAASSAFSAADLHLLAAGDPSSGRPSSVADDDHHPLPAKHRTCGPHKYSFSLARIFKKDNNNNNNNNNNNVAQYSPMKKDYKSTDNVKKTISATSAKEVIRKYLKKVKPLYEKLSSKHNNQQPPIPASVSGGGPARTVSGGVDLEMSRDNNNNIEGCKGSGTTSFVSSGNLKCGRIIKRRYVASCPSSMRSSPSHSGVLNKAGLPVGPGPYPASSKYGSGSGSSESSTMEELQNAIQGAIAHCKNSMLQQNTSGFNSSNNKGKSVIEIM